MSLDFSFKNCDEQKVPTSRLEQPAMRASAPEDSKDWSGEASHCTWMGFFIGIGGITKGNVDEVIRRWYIRYEAGLRVPVTIHPSEEEYAEGQRPEPFHMKAEAIRDFVGFYSNTTDWTKAQFNKHIMAELDEAAKQRLKKESFSEAVKPEAEPVAAGS
jgi:hypothetical protein